MHPALALFAPDRAIERREGQTSSHIYRPGDGDPTHRIMVTKSDLLTSSPRTAKRSSQKSEQFSSRPLSTCSYGNSGSKFPKKIRLLPGTGVSVRRERDIVSRAPRRTPYHVGGFNTRGVCSRASPPNACPTARSARWGPGGKVKSVIWVGA